MTSTEHSHGHRHDAAPGPANTVRPTRQRRAVSDVMSTFDDFRSAQEIHALLTERGEAVGLATVYRTLQLLSESGEVDMLRTEDGESAIYRRCHLAERHHHHLVCRHCGATVEVEGPAVEKWTESIAAEHGFSEIAHTLELFGTCPRCAAEAAAAGNPAGA